VIRPILKERSHMSNVSRRVVVTGMGVVSPLGCDIDRFWSRLIAGQSGVGLIHNFTTQYPYNEPSKMILDLTDQAYVFIRDGWHYN